MTVFVALLRGVNVGGRGKLPMADLRAIATDLGYADVATYVQSGNLVLSTKAKAATVAGDLERAIAAETDVSPRVLVRTGAQLAKLLRVDPFLERGEDPSKVHIGFTDGVARAAVAGLDLAAYAPDEAAAIGHEVHLFLPNGMGRSKLGADIGRQKATTITVRNLRTVRALLEMATASGS